LLIKKNLLPKPPMHQIVSFWAQVSSPQHNNHIISATFWNKFIEKQKWQEGLSEWNSLSKPQKPRDIMHYPLLQHTKLWFSKSTRSELDQILSQEHIFAQCCHPRKKT
jgi:hypothetical protein